MTTSFRKALTAAIIKSLLRGKSLIQAILSYWLSPLSADSKTKAPVKARVTKHAAKTIQDFLKEAETALLGPSSGGGLVKLSAGLKQEFYDRLQNDPECMLPSFSHRLPDGTESGQYLTLDVGGSTLRVALVELKGRTADAGPQSEIVSMRNFSIHRAIKDLEGMDFFYWMGARIAEVVDAGIKRDHSPEHPLPMALAWSFPIEQTSLSRGKLQGMGKGFMAENGLFGHDLGEIVKMACEKQGLDVELKAILNDSSACLLSQAYARPSTRFGLVLGTGSNVAAYLPASSIGRSKFGVRPDGWFDMASHVIVNTEASMFGRKHLPLTRWDHLLLKGHRKPDFQPLEYLVSGMYLGEVCRFALIEAIETTGVFGGVVPPSLKSDYSLSTQTLALVESDKSSDLAEACEVFAERHPSPHEPTRSDLAVVKELASFISVRSSALIATAVYTLWEVRLESQEAYCNTLPEGSAEREVAEADTKLETTTVAFNGSVVESYPGYHESCQRYINELVQTKNRPEWGSIELVAAKESSLLGAAVALACVEDDKA